MSAKPDLIITRPYMHLKNETMTDRTISTIANNNVQAGQIVFLDKYTLRDTDPGGPGTDWGRIYLRCFVDPTHDFTMGGNVLVPQNLITIPSDLAGQQYDLLEIKHTGEDFGGSYYKVTKTIVQLIYDGQFWNVVSATDNVYYLST